MKKIFNITLILVFTIGIVIPTNVKAAGETLQDYINLMEQYEREYNEAQSQVNLTQEQINQINAEIVSINNQISQIQNEITKLHAEITEANLEIKEKSLESEELFKYFQVANSEDVHVEYIFGADDINDMIYRMHIVEQLTEYNDTIIKELESLIEANNQREIELDSKSGELNEQNIALASKRSELEGEKLLASEGAVSSKKQLENQQGIVDAYEAMGCKPADVIGVDCATGSRAVGWYYPTSTGRLTSALGYRWGTFHQGTDIGSNYGTGEKIYPVANGIISSIYYDNAGALCVIIYHQDAAGKWYSSLYAHLSSWSPHIYVGKEVTHLDYIGYMGNTGYSFGVHLHLEIIDCRIFDPTDKNCSKWNSYASYIKAKYDNYGYDGAKDKLSLPSVWYSR